MALHTMSGLRAPTAGRSGRQPAPLSAALLPAAAPARPAVGTAGARVHAAAHKRPRRIALRAVTDKGATGRSSL
jgi:hypothetical protein